MRIDSVKMPDCWKQVLKEQFEQPYMAELRTFLVEQLKSGKTIFPPSAEYFSSFELSLFEGVKVVILGQDPYHGDGQAHGLSFSVPVGVPVPPSLLNIYKELKTDLAIEPASHGHLKRWAEQGVLLLNSVLTVERGKAGSHQKRGWEMFTDAVIAELSARRENVVFILWGSYAQKKGKVIDREKHLVLESPHPSPLSAHRGFFGTKPFSQANQYLLKHGKVTINWELPNYTRSH